MKAINLIFENTQKLQEFIVVNNLYDKKNILIQIFSGIIDKNQLLTLSAYLKKELPTANIIGTTTAGEIYHGRMYEQKIVISFLVMETTTVNTTLFDYETDGSIDTRLQTLITDDVKALIVFSDGLKSNAEELLQKINLLNKELIIAGGRAADLIEFKQTFVFDDERCSENGCVIATLSGDDLVVNNDYLLNWNPIGREFIVTKSQENQLFELDGIPIVEVYRKYLGDDVANHLPISGNEFPLLIKKEKSSVARVPIAKLEDNSLLYGGYIKEGDKLQFSFGNIEYIKNSADENFKNLKDIPSEAIFIYSCSARKTLMGKGLESEFNVLETLAPSSGFFTYGEYFYSNKSNELLNVTTTFLSLSETKQTKQRESFKKIDFGKSNRILTALTHLTAVTTEELNNSYSILNTAQSISKIGSWEWDILNNQLWWSDEIYNIFELDKNSFKACYEVFLNYIHPDDRAIVNDAVNLSLNNKNIEYKVEHRVVTENKKIKIVREQAEVIRDENNKAIKMIGTVQDITEEKEKLTELISLKQKAEASVKSKSEFLANMSHEIRTPLNAILGFVELLKEESKGRKSMEYVEIIDSSSNSLLKIIEDILDFSKIESGKLDIEKIDFYTKSEFEVITHLFSAKCSQKDISLSLIQDENLPKIINTDPLRIKQIISNLLSNAIKFTDNGKRIIINISYENGFLTVSVKDEGKGIAKDKLSHIFEAFSQEDTSTTREFGGTGLGLSISSELVKLLGGELQVKSELGVGSEFYFSIPITIGDTIEKLVQREADISFNGKKILLVEDNPANQMFMKIILKKIDLEYDLANDGLEAIDKFQENNYDAILMDENMPNMNGIRATAELIKIEKERKLKHTPIIALTANALKGDRDRFISSGMDDYLSKPLNKKKLTEVLQKLIGNK